MRTIETTLYTFEELSETAKKKAIEQYSDVNTDCNWWRSTYEDAENIGLKITSFDLDRNRHAEGKFILSAPEVVANIFRDHGETCETYKTATAFIKDFQPVFSAYLDENSPEYESYATEQALADMEEDFLKSLLEDYSIILQEECEYLISDEAIKETIISNDYEFTEDGERV
jgi:hypothetical protein